MPDVIHKRTEQGGLLMSLNDNLDSAVTRLENCARVLNTVADLMFGPANAPMREPTVADNSTASLVRRLQTALDNLESSVRRFDG